MTREWRFGSRFVKVVKFFEVVEVSRLSYTPFDTSFGRSESFILFLLRTYDIIRKNVFYQSDSINERKKSGFALSTIH